MDKLSIEDAEDIAEKGFTAKCMMNVPTGEKLSFIGQQLLTAMRENEMLWAALTPLDRAMLKNIEQNPTKT